MNKDKGAASSIVLGIVAIVVVVVVVVGGYQLGWWLKEDAVNRRAQINQDSFGRQNALVEQILDDVREAEDPNIPNNQRIAIVNQICDSAAKLTGSIELPPSAQNFVNQEC